jgi:CheY-like chemotaxis protein
MWIPVRFRTAHTERVADRRPEKQTLERDRRETPLPSVLAVTSDDRLYYLLLSASIDLHWKITWARTLERALELYRSQPIPLVIYDQRLPGLDWRDVLPEISRLPDHPVVLLAASEVNEEIWELVLRRSGYDAVERSSGSQEWRRALWFAWLSKSERLLSKQS